MINDAKTIVFAGSYELGEKVSLLQKRMVKDALELKKDVAIIIGDISFNRKIITYFNSGINGLVNLYGLRRENCNTICILSQLPNKGEEKELIDLNQYKMIENIIKEKDPDLYDLLYSKVFDYDDLELLSRLSKLVKKEVIPELVNYIKVKINVTKFNVKIFYESNLRNIISYKISTKRKGSSWRKLSIFRKAGKKVFLGNIEITNNLGIPICRGIMFCVYLEVVKLGYERLIEFDLEKAKSAITKAQILFDIVSKEFYPNKELTFENYFY